MSNYILIAMIVIQAVIQASKMHTVTIYEDGSFGIGYQPYAFHGCLPLSPCGQPELIIHDDRMDVIFQ